MAKSDFSAVSFSSPAYLRVYEYFCEPLGSIIPHACVLRFVVSLTLSGQYRVYNYGEFKISVAIPKIENATALCDAAQCLPYGKQRMCTQIN